MIGRITYDSSMWFLQQQGLTMKFRRVARNNDKGLWHLGRGGYKIPLINNSKGGNPYLTLSVWQRNYVVWVEASLSHYRVTPLKLHFFNTDMYISGNFYGSRLLYVLLKGL